jgi:hypothetical protein
VTEDESCPLTLANAFYVGLKRFRRSSERYAHWHGDFFYTEGVRFLAEHAYCYWLINVIAVLQERALTDCWLRHFQLWELFVYDHRGVLICSRDSEDEAFRRMFRITSFPVDALTLYVQGGVLMLPTEH